MYHVPDATREAHSGGAARAIRTRESCDERAEEGEEPSARPNQTHRLSRQTHKVREPRHATCRRGTARRRCTAAWILEAAPPGSAAVWVLVPDTTRLEIGTVRPLHHAPLEAIANGTRSPDREATDEPAAQEATGEKPRKPAAQETSGEKSMMVCTPSARQTKCCAVSRHGGH